MADSSLSGIGIPEGNVIDLAIVNRNSTTQSSDSHRHMATVIARTPHQDTEPGNN